MHQKILKTLVFAIRRGNVKIMFYLFDIDTTIRNNALEIIN